MSTFQSLPNRILIEDKPSRPTIIFALVAVAALYTTIGIFIGHFVWAVR